MDIQKLKVLTDKLNATDKEISDIVENSAALISSKKEKIKLEDQIEKIHELEEQIGNIIIKRNNAITKLCRDEKKALADCESDLAEANLYGNYNISYLMPILTDIAKKIELKEFDYKIYDYINPACIIVENHVIHYHFEVLGIATDNYPLMPLEILERTSNSSFWPYIIAESPKPTEIGLQCEDVPYANRSKFLKTHQFARYDIKEGTFKFVEISSTAINNTPSYVKDFICYASNYRLEHDLKKISTDELKELENKFLEENRDRYKEQARNLKK